MKPISASPTGVSAALLALVAGTLGAVLASPPAAADVFTERWCSSGASAPCLLSATRNGVALTPDDPRLEFQMPSDLTVTSGRRTTFFVTNGLETADLSATFVLTFDLGAHEPDLTESYASRADVDRIDDGDGTHRLRFTARPVLLTFGCNDAFPVVCPETATSQSLELQGEISELTAGLDLTGFDQSQNVDVAYLTFNSETPSEPASLESTWGNSHFQADGTTVVLGEARYRLPYRLLRQSFGIPDPATMTSASLAGSINGRSTAFGYTHDPGGGAIFVDVDGVTFSSKTIRVEQGTITPTKPRLKKAKRANRRTARLTFTKAKARGAKVKRYQVRCTPRRKASKAKTIKRNVGPRAYRSPVKVKRLTPGTRYTCQVRAVSKVGPGKWSRPRRV